MSGSRRVGRPEVWRNWARTVRANPVRVASPSSTEALVAEVRRAAADGLSVRAVGTGHSFTPVAATGGVLLRPERLSGVRRLDREAGTVSVAPGTPLWQLNAVLAGEGHTLANMGDIAEQTVAGAVSTGTHGTGRGCASLSAQLRSLEMVLADGTLARCSARENPELFDAARVGLGALGVLSELTFAVEPMFLLHAREEPMGFDAVCDGFDELASGNDHFEFYWFPHTELCTVKRNNRAPGPARPLPRLRRWLDDELLANGVFQAACSVGRVAPPAVPGIAQVAARALSAREYTDVPYRVFTSPRRVRFKEMEYALPREAAVPALRELKAYLEGSRLRVAFPVEVRLAPADDAWLSTAYGRESAYVAVHTYRGAPHQAYFAAAERIMAAYGGRPHWGKLHTRDAEAFAELYPRFADFRRLRDRLDPDRVFGNGHLRRVLGAG